MTNRTKSPSLMAVDIIIIWRVMRLDLFRKAMTAKCNKHAERICSTRNLNDCVFKMRHGV